MNICKKICSSRSGNNIALDLKTVFFFYEGGERSAWGSIKTAISFPAHWGVGVGGMARGVGVPVPPPGDLLATISMFEQQIKAEPMR